MTALLTPTRGMVRAVIVTPTAWEAQIRRSVFMDDIVYTISDLGVRADDIRDLASGEIAQVLTLHQDHNPAHANGCD
uniref:Uncharacterized protein n=1 Tax=uncultured bacterium HF186_25m_27D22 TaxID=662889 RepID=C7FPJ9_9BACT|nr:hypothetical protein [uncultured bacterium HF186_25m_27D22]